MKSLPLLFALSLAFPACALTEPDTVPPADPGDGVEPTGEISSAAVDCTSRVDTGYKQGAAYPITVVTVNGKPVETATANAFYVMQQAAAKAGVNISVVSGFRTMAEQQYLYNCYLNQNCNNGNKAAKPGYSNHQSGHALDLTTGGGAYAWLKAHATQEFGFKETVSGEPWHWEWWGGGPGGGICGVCEPHCEGAVMVNSDCSKGNCGAFGASCADDDLGLRCVAFGCPAKGKKEYCVDDRYIGNCNDGAFSKGDCGAFASKCVKDGAGAKCESLLCPNKSDAKACIDGAKLLTCKDGAPSVGDCSVFGAACTEELGEPRCLAPYAAKLVKTTSDAVADDTKAAKFKVCAGEVVTTNFEVRNEGYLEWTDVNGLGKAQYGKAMRLGVPAGDPLDPITGGNRWSVKNNDNNKVVWNGPDCNDKPGCRRTVFAVTGTAPEKVGVYTTRWKLLDEKKVALDEPILETTYRVEECERPGEPPPEGGAGGVGGADGGAGTTGTAGTGGATSAGGATAAGGATSFGGSTTGSGGASTSGGSAGSLQLAGAGGTGGGGNASPRGQQGGTEDSGSCSLTHHAGDERPGTALAALAVAGVFLARKRRR